MRLSHAPLQTYRTSHTTCTIIHLDGSGREAEVVGAGLVRNIISCYLSVVLSLGDNGVEVGGSVELTKYFLLEKVRGRFEFGLLLYW